MPSNLKVSSWTPPRVTDLLFLLVEQLPQTRPCVSRQDTWKFGNCHSRINDEHTHNSTKGRVRAQLFLPPQSCSCLLLTEDSSLANSLQQGQSQLCNRLTPSTMNCWCCSNLLSRSPDLCLGVSAEYFNGSNLQGSLCYSLCLWKLGQRTEGPCSYLADLYCWHLQPGQPWHLLWQLLE